MQTRRSPEGGGCPHAAGLLARPGSPAFTAAVKAAQRMRVTVSAGPSGFLESRIATIPGRLRATSTQLSLAPLKELLRHSAVDRSGVPLGLALFLSWCSCVHG